VVAEDARVAARDALAGSHSGLCTELEQGLNPYVAAAAWMAKE